MHINSVCLSFIHTLGEFIICTKPFGVSFGGCHVKCKRARYLEVSKEKAESPVINARQYRLASVYWCVVAVVTYQISDGAGPSIHLYVSRVMSNVSVPGTLKSPKRKQSLPSLSPVIKRANTIQVSLGVWCVVVVVTYQKIADGKPLLHGEEVQSHLFQPVTIPL